MHDFELTIVSISAPLHLRFRDPILPSKHPLQPLRSPENNSVRASLWKCARYLRNLGQSEDGNAGAAHGLHLYWRVHGQEQESGGRYDRAEESSYV